MSPRDAADCAPRSERRNGPALGAAIYQARTGARLTLDELGAVLGVSGDVVAAVELGTADRATLGMFARAMVRALGRMAPASHRAATIVDAALRPDLTDEVDLIRGAR